MTWQIVVLVLGVLAFVGLQSYISVLRERTSVARMTLGQQMEQADDFAPLRNGS